ncbi:hypothetical protein NBE98_03355 [Clostridium swellfunianum]|uniref:DUF6625 family protein n=1 Tax=Clostridium swellfunianum TaxID=1367462 RepID=UPI00202DDAD2|nr:DUF6625 family protein [Clostridium swellfunianum]MCM0647413.1 hypothetical protein [Clostridium swellfunianum]
MKNKILIICAYFGKLPNYIQLWLNSCSYNKEFNWLVITDDNTENLIVPSNVTFEKMTLHQLKKLIFEKTKLAYNSNKPYKLCDYKIVYGEVFADYLKQYTHWGHCDIDVIYGDLPKYITDDLLNKYDKVFNKGHLTIYKNTEEVNGRYKLDNPYFDYKAILESEKHYGLDENRGLPRIYKFYNINYIDNPKQIVDINPVYSHFSTLENTTTKQCFYWEEGKLYRALEDNGKIIIEELMYIHFQKRYMPVSFSNQEKCQSMFITNKGFLIKETNEFNFNRLNERTLTEDIKRKFSWRKLQTRNLAHTIFVFKEKPNFLKTYAKLK